MAHSANHYRYRWGTLTNRPMGHYDGFIMDLGALSLEHRDGILSLIAEAFEAAGDGIAIFRAPRGSGPPTFITVNRYFEEVFGYASSELAGRTPEVLYGPATSRAAISDLRRSATDGARVMREVQLYRRNGSPVWIEGTLSSLGVGASHWVGVYRDIRIRKDSEERLRLLTAAFDAATEVVFVTDATLPADGGPLVLYANRQYFEETGFDSSDVIGQSIDRLFGADGGAEADKLLTDAIAQRRESHVEVLARRKDGSTFWFDTHSRPVFDDSGRYANRIFVGSNVTERRRLEERVTLLTHAIEQADDNVMIFEADPDRGEGERLIYVNDAIVSRTGFAKEELFRDSTALLFGAQTDLAAHAQFIADVRAGRAARAELQFYRKDGSTYWAEVSGRAIPDERGRMTRWLVMERDVTARRAGEVWLRTLSSAIDNATDFIFVTDSTPVEQGGPYMRWANETMLDVMGYTLEEVAGKSPAMFWGRETDPSVLRQIRDAISSGEQASGEFLAYRKNGTTLWVEFSGKILSTGGYSTWIAVGRDVTERRALQERVAAESFTLATLFDLAQRFNASFDASSLQHALEEGVSILLRGEARIVHERSKATVLGASVGLAISLPPGRELSDNEISAVQLAIQSYEAAARRAAVYVALEEQRTTMMALSAHKSELIAMLAHDFKNPLATILGFAEMLGEPQIDDEDRTVATKTIGDAAHRLLALANDTLALAQLEQNELVLNFEPLDFVALVAGVVDGWAAQRKINFTHQPDRLAGFGDRARLRQAIDNLVSNAIKYSPLGAPVDVTLTALNNKVCIRIIDRGIGVPAAEADRIFERFSRASNALTQQIAGTGLGLSFVRAVIQEHGGTVTLESSEGQGSMFEVNLPLDPDRHERETRAVFVIDSDGDGRSFAAHALRRLGYTVKVHAGVDAVPVDRLIDERATLAIDFDRVEGSRRQIEQFVAAARKAMVPVFGLAVSATRVDLDIPIVRKPFLEHELRAVLEGISTTPV